MSITETKAALYDQVVAQSMAQQNIQQLTQYLQKLLAEEAAKPVEPIKEDAECSPEAH